MVSISSHKTAKGKGVHKATGHHGDASSMVTSKQGLMGVKYNHTTTNPLRASSMAKPRSREANIEIKHRDKQA